MRVHLMVNRHHLTAVGLGMLLFTESIHADIFRWDTGEVIPGTEEIELGPGIDLSGWSGDQHHLRYADFSGGVDLSNSHFYSSWLTNARFAEADLANTNFNAAELTNVDFRGADLTGANLGNAVFHGVDLTDANIRSVSLWGATWHDFTAPQLYATASYKARDLQEIRFWDNDLSGWDFAQQDLARADFEGANLTGADFTAANLTGVHFENASLDSANLTRADLRRASALSEAELNRAIRDNAILPNGVLEGLDLQNSQTLVLRDLDLGIVVTGGMEIGVGSTIQILLEDGRWGSVVSVETGLTTHLGGTLELTFVDNADFASLVEEPLVLFEWNGTLPAEERFAEVKVPTAGNWDLSQLYGSGQVVLEGPALAGDVNFDRQRSGLDLDLIAAAIAAGSRSSLYDIDLDGDVALEDFRFWVHDLEITFLGDANLDGEFNSSDMVQVFADGKYETNEAAGWAEGDWDGSLVFDSTDMVAAFADGGYERGPRMDAAAVPEPGGWPLFMAVLFAWIVARRSRFPI